MVVAGFRSIPITFAAGLGFGVVQNLIFGYTPDFLRDVSGFNSSIVYILAFPSLWCSWDRTVRRSAGQADAGDAASPGSLGRSPAVAKTPHAVADRHRGSRCYVHLFIASDFWAGQIASGLALSLIHSFRLSWSPASAA